MSKLKELKEDELENVSGGAYGSTMLHVECACGCKMYHVSGMSTPQKGTVLGTCVNGWVATYIGCNEVKFYNEEKKETVTKSLSNYY